MLPPKRLQTPLPRGTGKVGLTKVISTVSRPITSADRQTEMSEEEGSEMVQRAPQAIGSLIPSLGASTDRAV